MVAVGIVIPAHNEESVLGRCLSMLLADTSPEMLDIVVVANGCSDRTATVARRAGVRVVETANADKAAAIRMGDSVCRTFPRLYLDADVEVSGSDVVLLADELTSTSALACAPEPAFDLSAAHPVAAAFHRVHRRLLRTRDTLSGAGAYMLTEQGHRRAFPLPDIISDDGWVHRSFHAEERLVVGAATSVVRPPRTVAGIVQRRARVRLGNRQLDQMGCVSPERSILAADLRRLLARREVKMLDAFWFVLVIIIERVVARVRLIMGNERSWSKDLSARNERVTG